MPKYNRILLKLSGEGLMGKREYGISPDVLRNFAKEVKKVKDLGVQIAIVIGGGNIFRGVSSAASESGIERTSADYMGMLATVINAIALQSALEHEGLATRVQSAIPMASISEPYIRRRAIRHMEKGRIVIFAAGTGNPFFTTDTAAALRAVEMNCDAIFKGTQVDGIYSADPKKDSSAVRFDEISYDDVMLKRLAVMDISAVVLARDNNIPIVVFDMQKEDGFKNSVLGTGVSTTVVNK